MQIRPTIAGLWLTGAQFYCTRDESYWAANAWECSPSAVIPLECGAPVDWLVYTEPANRMFPEREIVWVLLDFQPGDIDLSGAVNRWDWLAWVDDRYDFNGDGVVTIDDDAAVMAAMQGCP